MHGGRSRLKNRGSGLETSGGGSCATIASYPRDDIRSSIDRSTNASADARDAQVGTTTLRQRAQAGVRLSRSATAPIAEAVEQPCANARPERRSLDDPLHGTQLCAQLIRRRDQSTYAVRDQIADQTLNDQALRCLNLGTRQLLVCAAVEVNITLPPAPCLG